jgi:oligopeptidase A
MKQFDVQSLPHFRDPHPEEMAAHVRALLDHNRQALKALLTHLTVPTWDTLMQPLENMSDQLHQAFSPIGHLHAVMQSDTWRKTYNDLLPLITDYYTELAQNEALFKATAALAESPAFKTYSPAQRKIIENDLRDFKLAGIHLPPDKKSRLQALQQQLAKATTQFAEHVLDATQAFTLHLITEAAIEGLPEQAKILAKESAKERGLEGYLLTLDYPAYSAAMKYLMDRGLRKQLYDAYVTRASDQGPYAGKWDNSPLMAEILKIRHEIAQLVGFDNYATYSLATKMAKTPEEVLTFLHDLVVRSRPLAEKEYEEVRHEAERDGITDFSPWDMAYYSEKLQAKQFHFTQEEIRPFFPIDRVMKGLFEIVKQLYGLAIQVVPHAETWHPDVKFFAIYDREEKLRGGFYIDLYARANKREGAWMDDCIGRRRLTNDTIQHPVAFLTCNFMRPGPNQPALLTHDDVLTLFHEFGHCLHHILTQVDYLSASGINQVPWDAVEFPSQFMENYVWEKECLTQLSGHYQTGEPLPDTLYRNLLASKYFQTGLQMLRQLEFSLFDFRLHLEYSPTRTHHIQQVLDEVRKETSIAPLPAYHRFQHTFSHIFAGGYAAGYYSYKWAEVLSADAYGAFQEKGILDSAEGQAFMKNILEVGGSKDPMEAFIAFRGRKPTVDALLKSNGLEVA